MNATHLKLGRKLYRKSNSIGNGIIYMVRRDKLYLIIFFYLLLPLMADGNHQATAGNKKSRSLNEDYSPPSWARLKLHVTHSTTALNRGISRLRVRILVHNYGLKCQWAVLGNGP